MVNVLYSWFLIIANTYWTLTVYEVFPKYFIHINFFYHYNIMRKVSPFGQRGDWGTIFCIMPESDRPKSRSESTLEPYLKPGSVAPEFLKLLKYILFLPLLEVGTKTNQPTTKKTPSKCNLGQREWFFFFSLCIFQPHHVSVFLSSFYRWGQ